MPGLHFWLTGPAIFLAGSFALATTLAVMGVRDMTSPARALISVAAAVLLAIGWWGTAVQEEKNAATEKQNAELKTGMDQIREKLGIIDSGDVTPKAILESLDAQRKSLRDQTKNNYAFYTLTDDRSTPAGLLKLCLDAAPGAVFLLNHWVYRGPTKRTADDPEYIASDKRKPIIPVVRPRDCELGRPFAIGDWIIEFDSLGGHWEEFLSLRERDGQLKQKIKVVGDKGQVLYEREDK